MCKFEYWGESHRTLFDRAAEHSKALLEDSEDNAPVKHRSLHHPGLEPEFKFHHHKTWKNSLSREIGEALAISEANPALLMNSRGEWGTTTIPRVVLKFPEDLESTQQSNPDAQTLLKSNTTISASRPKRKRQFCPKQPSAKPT